MSTSSTDSSNTPQNGNLALISNETLLITLITIMTVFTAVAAFQASLAGGENLKYAFIAQAELTDASSLYVEQGQELFYDHAVYDQYQAAMLRGEGEVAEYYFDQLSGAAVAAVERSTGYPFDEEYENALFVEADAKVEAAEEASALSGAFNQKGDRLGLVTTILAIGLAFAAWASLADSASRQRTSFALLSIAALVVASIEYIRILTSS